ncbi:MAG: MerR family transcriptional regulator [Flavobacteriia bacterium]|nr:MerR family transcriptional regulator [Flavobacteriia bacterium]
MYYSIGEVASLLNVNTSLLRYWEKEFKIKIEKKSKAGKRFYTVSEIGVLTEIYILLKEKGYTIDGAKKELDKNNDGHLTDDFSKDEIIEKLESIKKKLKNLISL